MFQVVGASSNGGIQPLHSPGSCLQNFRALPFIECNNNKAKCHHWQDGRSYWLKALDLHEQFVKPLGTTYKANPLPQVSRCAVCRKSIEVLPQ